MGMMPPGEAKGPSDFDKYDVEDGARTLERAHEIKSKPKLHHAIKKHVRKRMSAMRSIAGKK